MLYYLHMMNIQKTAKYFGIVTLILGVIGFIPGVVAQGGFLFGVFLISVLLNIIHIIVGLTGIESAASENLSVRYFRIIGIVFAVLAIFGFISNGTIMTTNTATNVLMTVFALFALYQGFASRSASVSAPVL